MTAMDKIMGRRLVEGRKVISVKGVRESRKKKDEASARAGLIAVINTVGLLTVTLLSNTCVDISYTTNRWKVTHSIVSKKKTR